jgi:hypothetical protein
MSEVIKLVTCLFLVFRDENSSMERWRRTIYETIWINKMDTIKVGTIIVRGRGGQGGDKYFRGGAKG